MKYAIDRLAGLILLILLAPLLGIVAFLIKMDDRGPVFFRQERLGLGGKLFNICKFRTMIPNADRLLDEKGRVGNVNRLTRVGRILRSLSLDELPQLLNIVKGEMSFIGPRPTVPQHWPRYTERQKDRFRMKPGVTGWAQVSGRNTLKWSQRIECDLWYIENYSLLVDLRILAKTAKVVFLRRGVVLDRNPEQVDDLGAPSDLAFESVASPEPNQPIANGDRNAKRA
jgi:lipopolysaccharide/colanic/teichoic acid biosynthesis glycosyltransferase